MTHLDDDELLVLLRAGDPPAAEHLKHCDACGERLARWRRLASASAIAAGVTAEPVRAPAFDALLGPVLEPPRLELASPGLATSASALGQLARAQLRLLPWMLPVLTLLALAAAVVLALAVRAPQDARAVFGAAVTAILVSGALGACGRRSDPRNELLASLAVSPMTVSATRLTLVLTSGMLLGVVASVVVVVAGGAPALPELLASWFGQALLASGAGVLASVWRTPDTGAMTGSLIWAIGLLGSLRRASWPSISGASSPTRGRRRRQRSRSRSAACCSRRGTCGPPRER